MIFSKGISAVGGSPFFVYCNRRKLSKGVKTVSFKDFLLETDGDMVERGLILAAIVVAAVTLWFSIGTKLAARLGTVNSAF